jgi:carbamoyl-phosphate synthase large subunit
LTYLLGEYDNPIVQEYVDGREFTVDVLTHSASRVLSAVPRERLSLQEGVSDKGVTVENDDIVDDIEAICERVGHRGFTNIQFIESGGERIWLEVNPRVAGGLALGLAASQMPKQFATMLIGDSPDSALSEYERQLHMAKYDGVQFFREEERQRDVGRL